MGRLVSYICYNYAWNFSTMPLSNQHEREHENEGRIYL